MNKDVRRKMLADEISRKIAGKRNVSIDYIKVLLDNDVLLYIPSFPASNVLLEEWDKVSQFNLIITSKIVNFRKMCYGIQDAGCIGDLLEGRFIKNLVLTLEQVEQFKEKLLNSYFLTQNFSTIFDDCEIEMIRHFNTEERRRKNFIDHWLFKHSVFNFFITRTPSTFKMYIQKSFRFVNFYTHRSYLETSFLKAVENSGQMIYYDSSIVDKNFLALIKNKNTPRIFKIAEYLVNKGLFYSPLFKSEVNIENTFISGKIAALLATLENTKGYLTLIYINDPLEQFIICKILLFISRTSENEISIDFDLLERMIEQSIQLHTTNQVFIKQPPLLAFSSLQSVIDRRTVRETGILLNVQFIHNIKDRKNAVMYNIILFDYIPFIGRDYKIFILPLSFKDAFAFQIEEDIAIAKHIWPRQNGRDSHHSRRNNLCLKSEFNENGELDSNNGLLLSYTSGSHNKSDILKSTDFNSNESLSAFNYLNRQDTIHQSNSINLDQNENSQIHNEYFSNAELHSPENDAEINRLSSLYTQHLGSYNVENNSSIDKNSVNVLDYPSQSISVQNSANNKELELSKNLINEIIHQAPSSIESTVNETATQEPTQSSNNQSLCNFHPNTIDFSLKPNSSNRSYRFYVLKGSIEEIKQKTRNRRFIVSAIQENDRIVVSANCFSGRAAACLNVHSVINEPVVMPKLPSPKSLVFSICDKFEFCTLTSFKTMVNNKSFIGNCFVMVSNKKVSLFSFTNERNLMIEFYSEDLENFILISLNKTGLKKIVKKLKDFEGPDTCNPFNNRTIEVYKESLVFSFCLKNKPRIYFCDQSDEIAMKLASPCSTSEKCLFFNKIEWKRLTANEFTDLEDRFDIRISIHCYQDLPSNVYDSLLLNLPLNEKQDFLGISTPMVRRYHLEVFVRALSSFPVQLVMTELFPISSAYTLKQILEYFVNFDFSEYYAMACLVSRKGRFLLSHVTQEDLEYIATQPLSIYCQQLDKTLMGRFEPVIFKIPYAPSKSLCSSPDRPIIRSVILTPMGFSFDYEIFIESNRVLRNFDPDKFCKLVIRDENGKDKFIYDATKNTDLVYEYFRNVLLNGFTLGFRKYFFLVMTNSQLKIHGSWFITPYEKDGIVIGSDYIKSWIGSFNSIRNIGKYAARIGLALSTTTFSRQVTDFVEIEDTTRNGYTFTDGIGLCSRTLATQICKDLGMDCIPSAFQIRFAGYKGVIAVHPWLDNLDFYSDSPSVQELVKMVKAKLITNDASSSSDDQMLDDTSPTPYQYQSRNDLQFVMPSLILRNSMNKFDSSCYALEIVNIPKSCDFFLNRQIIMMLEGLGVSSQVFIDFQNKYVYDLLVSIKKDFPTFVRTHSFLSTNVSTDIAFYRKLQAPIISKVFEELNTKSNILIPQGRGAMGVVDELGLLEEDQVFCMLTKRSNENMEGLIDYGSYVVPNCYCIVAKNPVMHPGDIRLVKCVDVPALHYLKDLIVFSKKGSRPLFNQCSGSDLDGDIFYLCWAKALIPKATFKPYNYNDTNALVKDRVLFSDIVNFFIRSMKFYQLGHIAVSYMAMADQHSVFHEKALKLSEIFNKSIDYVKTGNLVAIPDDLIPVEYPDFMERQPSYKSTRALGFLYRRSLFDISNIGYCECHNCTIREIQDFCQWKEFILLGSGIKTRETVYRGLVDNEYTNVLARYRQDILFLMNKFQLSNEESLFCEKNNPEIRNEMLKIIETYSALVKGKDSLVMSAISSCSAFSSLEVLCSDSYKLKTFIKKNIIKEGDSQFLFNSKIHLIDSVEFNENLNSIGYSSIDKLSYSFYNNTFELNELVLPCNKVKIDEFISSLDWKRKDIFKDFFNLIILSGLFKITEIDQIFEYFDSLNKLMVESTVLDLLRVAIPTSNDLSFKILCLLPLDFAIQKKCFLLREKVSYPINEAFKPMRICKRVCFIISGMLDENDDLEFVKKDKKFIPELRNKGKCSVDYYKDTLRDFVVNLLYSQENHQFLKSISSVNHIKNEETIEFKNIQISSGNLQENSEAQESLSRVEIVESQANSIYYDPETVEVHSSSENKIVKRPLNSNIEKDEIDQETKSITGENTPKLTIESRSHETVQTSLSNLVNDFLSEQTNYNEKKKVCIRSEDFDNYRAVYAIVLTPGEFFFTSVPITHFNDRMSVKFLEQILSAKNPKNTFDFAFNNVHDSLIADKANDFMKKIKNLERTENKEILSFVYNSKRYDIEYLDGKLFRITRNKIILGRAFILNNSERNDLRVEVFRRELIYNSTINLLDETEKFMIQELVILDSKGYLVLPAFENFTVINKVKIEKTVTFSNDDGFMMAHSELYSEYADGYLLLKNSKKSSFVYKEFSLKSLDNFNFDKIYGKLWKLYNQAL